ncbi:helix-turn-helix domain-containing protein [Devosia sp.]|uniref:helix-turn-helix domain-containing protein n=1 Tax=Devosia sp. TaxID=1871048 RepID=UPI003A937B42
MSDERAAGADAAVEDVADGQSVVAPVGAYLAEVRRSNGWTLAELARITGVSISTLSKIENNQTAPAYGILTKLAAGLGVDFAVLLGDRPSRPALGARAVTKAGQGAHYANEMGAYEALATELAAKSMEPMIVDIPADGRTPGRIRSAHEGEEFVYVLSGRVVFEMDPYAPRVLETGDSVYFDGSTSHGFSADAQGARILSICQVRAGPARSPFPDAEDSGS